MFMGLAQNLGNGWCDHQDLADGRRRGGPVLRPLVDGPCGGLQQCHRLSARVAKCVSWQEFQGCLTDVGFRV